MKNRVVACVVLLVLAACSKGGQAPAGSAGAPVVVAKEKAVRDGGQSLAYEHTLRIETGEAAVRPLHDRLAAACEADLASHCVLLESRQSGGASASARLKFRAAQAGIAKLIKLAGTGGDVAEQATSAEDLAAPIADSGKRIAMLQQYRQNLLDLQQKAKGDVDALIKVARELASTQSELEQAAGTDARLRERVATELLSVSIESGAQRSFWSRLRQPVAEFSDNLAKGIASAIEGLAYIVPWSAVILVLLLLGRKIWTRKKKPAQASVPPQ
jgi:hypothetical protein